MNLAPEYIKELDVNEIFVFGSNLRGKHGAGAALYALENFGAKVGVPEGIQGKSYGIPTRDVYIETLPIEAIKVYVDNFIKYAYQHQELKFLLTEIGCGRANYKPDDIALLFKDCTKFPNVYFPQRFIDVLDNK